ncbi:MAG: CoA transferase [Burkholderiales bacterium]|nr:CoA transferase [Burkholderiales bacterium]
MGPLHGIRIVEFAGIGPAPFGGMLLADMGADVIVIDRKRPPGEPPAVPHFARGRAAIAMRGKRSAAIDLRKPEGRAAALRLLAAADALLEGYRPGVMERLGLGPEVCLAHNPRLVYARMTGWGQTGPLASAAGHDVNYAALTGALHCGARGDGPPWAPPTLVADFGGGGMFLAFGVACGILEARRSGKGQVVDAAMIDGAALMLHGLYAFKAAGRWSSAPGTNLLDSAAPFYDTYQCADGRWITLGAIEPPFYGLMLEKLGLAGDPLFADQFDETQWPARKRRITDVIRGKTRDEWCALLEGTDVCFAPVLDLDEAPRHAHNAARETFVEIEGVMQPAPGPRFSRTPGAIRGAPPPATHTAAALADWGFSETEIDALSATGAID